MYAVQRYQRRQLDERPAVPDMRVVAGAHESDAPQAWTLGTRLPFRLVVVRDREQLDRAVGIRRAAYLSHQPELAERFRGPEPDDFDPGSRLLLAELKETGEAIGTLRIGTNLYGPTEFETHVSLPPVFAGQHIACVGRLAVLRGPYANEVKLALFKAMHRYCLATQVRFIVLAGVPPRDRWYDRLGFVDIHEKGRMFDLPSCFGQPARVQWAEVARFESMWRESHHPLYDFMFNHFFPDIEVFSSVSSMWSRPRRRRDDQAPPLQDSFGLAVI